MTGAPVDYTVVVPTLGRPSLGALLSALAGGHGPEPAAIVLVDDRRDAPAGPLPGLAAAGRLGSRLRVLRGTGRGPAAARNRGWRAASTPWVAFLDDDVVPGPDWAAALRTDLAAAGPDVGGSQGVVDVPLPAGRRPTDWERGTAGLATARWITADMAYRTAALRAVGGFDERFPRAFREDADLALRVEAAGWRLVRGSRRTTHPVRPADDWVSVRQQAGNADDVLMRRLHGPRWRERAHAPAGRRPRHVASTAAAAGALVALVVGRRRLAAALGAGWLTGTAELAWARIAPGPRTADEVRRMLLTSVAIPPAAVGHWLGGLVRHRGAQPWPARPALVLFDRDGTLVHDVPYNGDPALVKPVDGAREALDRLRAHGVRVGVVTNQSGVARGRLTRTEVEAVNAEVERRLGPFATWQVCPHGAADGCGCRKPAPGMVLAAAAAVGVRPEQVAVVGDIGADVDAALAAGGRGVLVPTPDTLDGEVAAAGEVAPDLAAAVSRLLGEAG